MDEFAFAKYPNDHCGPAESSCVPSDAFAQHFVLSAIRYAAAIPWKTRETMSRRAINFALLSKTDKAELKQLLQLQKKALEDALKATNKELYDLTNPRAAKKAKKAKKTRKVGKKSRT